MSDFICRDETLKQNLGVLGFENIVGYLNSDKTEEIDLQSIADIVDSMANNIQCPIYYGTDEPTAQRGFWLKVSN